MQGRDEHRKGERPSQCCEEGLNQEVADIETNQRPYHQRERAQRREPPPCSWIGHGYRGIVRFVIAAMIGAGHRAWIARAIAHPIDGNAFTGRPVSRRMSG